MIFADQCSSLNFMQGVGFTRMLMFSARAVGWFASRRCELSLRQGCASVLSNPACTMTTISSRLVFSLLPSSLDLIPGSQLLLAL